MSGFAESLTPYSGPTSTEVQSIGRGGEGRAGGMSAAGCDFLSFFFSPHFYLFTFQ